MQQVFVGIGPGDTWENDFWPGRWFTAHVTVPLLPQQKTSIKCGQHNVNDVTLEHFDHRLIANEFAETKPIGIVAIWIVGRNILWNRFGCIVLSKGKG